MLPRSLKPLSTTCCEWSDTDGTSIIGDVSMLCWEGADRELGCSGVIWLYPPPAPPPLPTAPVGPGVPPLCPAGVVSMMPEGNPGLFTERTD